ncbi:MAG: hypothetical protein KC917_01025 [Candidatus Omnitrophica bacterium]|nr:hypothetical protein [Candidatus Omnitrophota bacterium]
MFSFFKRHKIISTLLAIVFVPIIGLLIFVAYRSIGPYRSYRVNLDLPAPGSAEPVGDLLVGVAERDITPDLSKYESWTDVDNNGRFHHEKDTWVDSNGNGKLDTVWMAGFNNNRPAQGVHDRLRTQAIAFRNNGVTLVMVTIDSIGIFHETFIDIRKRLNSDLGIDHVMFSSTHCHEVPDTMGIWSYSPFNPSFDYGYMENLKQQTVQAIEEAVGKLQPAEMTLASAPAGPEGYVDDSRLPIVYDHILCAAKFDVKGTTQTIATVIEWGNHPETLGGSNTEITADFVHYLRQGVEEGVPEPNGVEGLGGMCLYFQGQCGGLMTQLHTTVPHRNGQQEFREASFEKAEALGENLAIVAVNALNGDRAKESQTTNLAVSAQSIFVPIDGLFEIAGILGLVHPGWFWGKARTEVDAIRIGDLEILTVPGELYPEVGNGGVESPEAGDFYLPPLEVPPLRDQMKGELNMIIGLANDELGYFVPKSQWDVEPPFAYNREKAQYGEENSMGPDATPAVHSESMAIIERLHATLERL